MTQNPSNSEPVDISEMPQHPIRFEVHVTSSGLEVTVTPEMPLLLTMLCHGRCKGISDLEGRISDLKRERDLAIGIAQEALDMVPGNGETVITFRAILDLIDPKRQDDRQDDIPKDAQDVEQGAAKARRMAKTREGAMLREGTRSRPLSSQA